MFRNLIRGALAGAAGTTVLNTVTYLDMAVRARPASDTPQQAVDTLAERSGHPVPGAGEERDRRLQGLGPLSGIAAGVGVGAFAGLLRPLFVRLPAPVGAVVLGALAMAASTGPLSALNLTDMREWSADQWATDVVPHLAYGAATITALRLDRP